MKLLRFLGPVLLTAWAIPALSADLGPSPPAATAVSQEELRSYIARQALLLQLRAAFDVEPLDRIAADLNSQVRWVLRHGITARDRAALNDDLLAEGSYYLVSLRYLIEAGGAVWPTDRSEPSYVNDARVLLDALQQRLFEATASDTDPLAIFQQLDTINAWTEGYSQVPANLDHFASRDALVEVAISSNSARVDL